MRRTKGVLALTPLALTLPAAAADPIPPTGGPSAAERDFITRHWRGAIAPQGPAPARFSPIERSLQPEACGACHPVQFSDWQASAHSKSMGPGITGQLVEMARREPAAARSCVKCHAPVAEGTAGGLRGGPTRPEPRLRSRPARPRRHLRRLPPARSRTLRPATQGRLDGQSRATRPAPARRCDQDRGLPSCGILRELPPVRG